MNSYCTVTSVYFLEEGGGLNLYLHISAMTRVEAHCAFIAYLFSVTFFPARKYSIDKESNYFVASFLAAIKSQYTLLHLNWTHLKHQEQEFAYSNFSPWGELVCYAALKRIQYEAWLKIDDLSLPLPYSRAGLFHMGSGSIQLLPSPDLLYPCLSQRISPLRPHIASPHCHCTPGAPQKGPFDLRTHPHFLSFESVLAHRKSHCDSKETVHQ